MGAPNGNELGLFVLLGSVLTLVVLFLALAIYGLVRIRKPGSQGMILTGFIGLAVSLIILSYIGDRVLDTFTVGKIFDFKQRSNLGKISAGLGVMLPVLVLLWLILVGFLKRSNPGSASFRRMGCLGIIVYVFFAGLIGSFMPDRGHTDGEAAVKSHAHAIQIGLERYAIEHGGLYPENIDDLLGAYLVEFPFNELVAGSMKNVKYGAGDVAGNFTYLPIEINQQIVGYYLLAYGWLENPGQRLMGNDEPDHVIIVIPSSDLIQGDLPGDLPVAWPPDTPFPSVKDVILSSQL
jgi:hypothetical protein